MSIEDEEGDNEINIGEVYPEFPIDKHLETDAIESPTRNTNRQWLEQVLELGLLQQSDYSSGDLRNLKSTAEVVSLAANLTKSIIASVADPFQGETKIVKTLELLSAELRLISEGLKSDWLVLPNEKMSIKPQTNVLKKLCVGYVRAFTMISSKEHAYRTVSKMLIKFDWQFSVHAIRAWTVLYKDVENDVLITKGKYVICTGFRLMGQLDEAEIKLEDATNFKEMEDRLEYELRKFRGRWREA